MAQETLKLVITADNADALAKIKQFSESLGAQTKEWEKNKKATGDATNALVNFSRLAEDSAYGLRGAANNINPFIESFKRLKDETGSTSSALLSMAKGLIGPAGILVAVSSISTILISYADSQRKAKKEAEEAGKTEESNAEILKKKKEAIDSIYESTAKEVTQVATLITILNNETESRKRKQDAIKELQKINPEVFKNLKLEGDEVKNLNTYYEKYIENTKNAILLKQYQYELEKIIKAELKSGPVLKALEPKEVKDVNSLLEQNKNIIQTTEATTTKLDTKNQNILKSIEKQNEQEKIKKDLLDKIAKVSGATVLGKGEGGTEKKDPFVEATKEFNNSVQTNVELRQKDLISEKSYFDNYLNIINTYLGKLKGIDTKQAKEALIKLTPKELIKSVSDTYDADLEAKAAGMDVFDLGKSLNKGANIQGNEPTPFSKQAFDNGKKELDEFFKSNNKNFEKAKRDAQKFNEEYSRILKSIGTDIAASLADSIGKLFAGGGLRDILSGFLNVLADGLINVGKLAIATGLAIEGIKDALKSLNPVVAITAGIALVALGSYVKSSLAQSADSMGAKKMAEGGIVSKPTFALVGEGNESEAVMPLSKLKGFLNTSFNAGAMSGGGAGGNGQFVLRGNDLVLALQRSNYSLNLRRGA